MGNFLKIVLLLIILVQAFLIHSQSEDLKRLVKSEDELSSSLQQLQVADENLKRADTKLKASCDKLEAANDEMRAAFHPLSTPAINPIGVLK